MYVCITFTRTALRDQCDIGVFDSERVNKREVCSFHC